MDYPKTLAETTFNYPDVFEQDPKNANRWFVNRKKSEIPFCLEALGTARIYYAGRRNKYFRDMDFKKPYTDEEIQAFGLPIPIEIENQRKKLMKQYMEAGEDITPEDLIKKTAPQFVEPPEHVKQRLAQADPLARDIARLNRATLGRK